MTRPSWHRYFLNIAETVASRSTCNRANVGAVIVKNRTILATGYNGTPRGCPHCDEEGHMLRKVGEKDSCIATVHAEVNAIAQAARTGVAIEKSQIYCTHNPCFECTKVIINSGISRIVYDKFYDSRFVEEAKLLASQATLFVYSIDDLEINPEYIEYRNCFRGE
jgi:dCMP deaminase